MCAKSYKNEIFSIVLLTYIAVQGTVILSSHSLWCQYEGLTVRTS